jgi:gamma-glutamyl hercynylcysteine S-oxide synthase
MTTTSTRSATHDGIAQMLAEARERTLLLVETVVEPDLRAQHDPLMSPILWDLGHIVAFEDLWLTENLDGAIRFSEMPGIFNPFEHPRRTRAALPLPSLEDLKQRMRHVRQRVLERLDRVDLESANPLLRDGYVYRMVAQHEYQHNETILQTLQLKTGTPYVPALRHEGPTGAPDAAFSSGTMVRVPAGEYPIGTDDRSAAYDNERPRHTVRVPTFWIDRTPVTNAEYLEFVEAGGYSVRDYWTTDGWAWRDEAGVTAPKHWERQDSRWITRSMDRTAPVALDHPVIHICFHEAEAYARFAGKRLPTEQEWEIAAGWDPVAGTTRRYPWGDDEPTAEIANIDQLAFGTSPVGAYPLDVSPLGCLDMIGNVWEWTTSDFRGYPAFEAFPYPEYSEVFFGTEYKVLRGGSWATRPGAIRNSFRNWDYPIRRQIFAGLRCARND